MWGSDQYAAEDNFTRGSGAASTRTSPRSGPVEVPVMVVVAYMEVVEAHMKWWWLT